MREQRAAILLLLATGAAVVLLAAGCIGTGQSPPSRFYMLSSIDPAEAPGDISPDVDGMGILLGPFRFPAYLKRQNLVIRTSPNKIELAEFDRWAEPLENNFVAVLKENLSILLAQAMIIEPPLPKNTNLEFQVVADVSRFDAEKDRQVLLMVRWAVVRIKDERVLMVRKSSYATTLGSSGIEEIVQAQSRIVADFSREVAAAVKELYRIEHGQ